MQVVMCAGAGQLSVQDHPIPELSADMIRAKGTRACSAPLALVSVAAPPQMSPLKKQNVYPDSPCEWPHGRPVSRRSMPRRDRLRRPVALPKTSPQRPTKASDRRLAREYLGASSRYWLLGAGDRHPERPTLAQRLSRQPSWFFRNRIPP